MEDNLSSFPESVDPEVIARMHAAGMLPSLHAKLQPDEIAIYSQAGDRTFSELNANANRLAAALRRSGMKPGDHLALLCPNVPEFVEAFLANLRSGFRIIPINWHLAAEEVAYIVKDSDAKAFIAHARFAETAAAAARDASPEICIAIGGKIESFLDYREQLANSSPDDPLEPRHGFQMLYTSGTTGRPKGVYTEKPKLRRPQWGPNTRKALRKGDVCLCLGPGYHAAPLGHSILDPLMAGIPVVLTEKFDAETTLAAIEKYRVTHTHMVATMFQRLLALPADVRARYDVSSLRCVVHGAAPTPPAVKRAMMDWWGPILDEYYGASEGSGGFYITAAEWLKKPGSVGRCLPEWGSRVVNENGEDCTPGEIGRVFFRFEAGAPFRYYKDVSKTESISLNGTHFTVGDLGYLDADGYLFLTGRSAECIISGGVNIYPQEIDHVLLKHPAVAEACAVGAPNDEWGEEVKAVVVLRPEVTPDPQLSAEIVDFVRSHVAAFKAPRSVEFVGHIPRSEAGKILRSAVRARYWEGRGRQI